MITPARENDSTGQIMFSRGTKKVNVGSCCISGEALVGSQEDFRRAVTEGMGQLKAFGCGMLLFR